MGGRSIGIIPMAISLCASFNSAYLILGKPSDGSFNETASAHVSLRRTNRLVNPGFHLFSLSLKQSKAAPLSTRLLDTPVLTFFCLVHALRAISGSLKN